MRQTIDPARAPEYPANIQAILKRQAPCSAWLNQALLEIDSETGFAKIAYELGEAHFNRFGALHGGAIACVMDDVLAVVERGHRAELPDAELGEIVAAAPLAVPKGTGSPLNPIAIF